MDNSPETYLNQIIKCAASFKGGSSVMEDLLVNYPQFKYWSGSSKAGYHHYGKYGLVRHTCEVIELGISSRAILGRETEVDEATYFFSALFHDTGKMFDYVPMDCECSTWASSPHKRIIHHISRSGIIWHDIIKNYPSLYELYHDEVLHAILAHHGKREYGSPIAPKSHVAWLLHHCDSISARMDDAGTLDVVKIPT